MIHASIYGRLGKDPQARTTANGKPMTLCSAAVDVTPNNAEEQETLWVSVMAFGKQAETLAIHQKGEMAAFTGRLTQSRWKDKATGEDRTGFTLVADSIVSTRTVRPSRKKPDQPQQSQPETEFFDDPMPF